MPLVENDAQTGGVSSIVEGVLVSSVRLEEIVFQHATDGRSVQRSVLDHGTDELSGCRRQRRSRRCPTRLIGSVVLVEQVGSLRQRTETLKW